MLTLSIPAERDFRALLTSRLCSALAAPAVPVLLVITTLSSLGGTRPLSVVLFAEAAPAVVFLFVAGVVSDRVSRRRLVIVADALSAGTCAAVVALLWTHHVTLLSLCLIAALNGANQALLFPAYRSLFPRTVARENLRAANSIRTLIGSLCGIIGPALIGAVLPLVGQRGAWAACAAGYTASAVLMLRVRADAQGSREDTVLAQMRASWDYFRAQKWLVAVDAYAAVWHLLVWAAFLVVGASLVEHAYGGVHSWGYLQAALGAGTVVGGLLTNRMRARRILVVAVAGVGAFGVLDIFLALRPPFALTLACAVLGGVGLSVGDVYWSVTLQARVPEDILGQIFSYDYLVSVALLPFGLLATPYLADAMGDRNLLLLAGAVSVLGVAVLCLLPSVRGLTDEETADAVLVGSAA
jgi:MFS family permease